MLIKTILGKIIGRAKDAKITERGLECSEMHLWTYVPEGYEAKAIVFHVKEEKDATA